LTQQSDGLPFVAAGTIVAMLTGFILIFLLPYNQILAWSLFSAIEATVCFVMARKMFEIKRRNLHSSNAS